MELKFFVSKGEVGGNQILLCHQGENMWLDFGLSFKKAGKYINPILEGRQLPKMHLDELAKMKVTPPSEYFENGMRVVVSHAHIDHYGALLAPLEHDIKVEIYAPEDNLRLLKARMEISNAGGLLEKAELMQLQPYTKKSVSDYEVIPIPVDHSIDASYSYLIFLPDGQSIYYTGDCRFDLISAEKVLETVRKFTEKPDIVISELTGVSSKNPLKEEDMYSAMSKVAQKYNGFATIFSTPSYTRRMEAIKQTFKDRTIIADSSYAYLLYVANKGRLIDGVFMSEKKHVFTKWERELEKQFNFIGETELRQKQNAFAVVLNPYHKLKLDFDFIPNSFSILSLTEPFDEEGFIHSSRLEAFLLQHRRIPIYHIHASGHAEAFEIAKFIEELKPSSAYLIHSQSPDTIHGLLPKMRNLKTPDYGENMA